jgi:hypothetical protein
MGLVYEDQGELKHALILLQKISKIHSSWLYSEHSDIVRLEETIESQH